METNDIDMLVGVHWVSNIRNMELNENNYFFEKL